MNYYDCIIIGDDIYALTIALFLTRKMRNILLINQPSPFKEKTEEVSIKHNDEKHLFKYRSDQIITGLDAHGLTKAFLNELGLTDAIEFERLSEDFVVDKQGIKKSRSNDFNDFKIYLMRYYPKQIEQIKTFFNDLDRHYLNYKEQYINLLHNNDYTLSSLMVEWGDYSLFDLLTHYYSDPSILNEFKTNNFINGLDLKKVSAYNFFSNYFIGLKSGFYFMRTPIENLRNILLKKIKESSKHSIVSSKITNITGQGQRIAYIEDSEGKQYFGKYYFVSDQPLEFYNDFFEDLDAHVNKLKSYYPYLENTSVKRTMYLVLDKPADYYDIKNLIYYYNDNDLDQERIIKIFNYGLANNKGLGQGELCIDFTYDKHKGYNEKNLLDKLYLAFPRLRKSQISLQYGKEDSYFAMLRDKKLRKKFSINELIDYESLNHLNYYDNLYIGGAFVRPESGFYGKIHQSVLTADKIEDNLYFKDETEDYYYSNDQVMMMLRQNYDNAYFGNKETHINFHIGKSFYFLRIKGRNIVLHSGKYGNPDLTIYTTNDQLIELIYKKTPYQDIIKSNFFKYSGEKDTLKAFLKAFDLDDRFDFKPKKISKPPFKYFGLVSLNLYLLFVSLAAFLFNYLPGIYIFSSAFFLISVLTIVKHHFTKKINVYEILLIFIFLSLMVLSIFLPNVNTLKDDGLVLIPIAALLFISVVVNRPYVREYLEYSYTKEFVQTKLFLSVTNGLSFIWGFIFVIIVFGPFFSGEKYVSVFYNFVFLGFILSHYYPSIYVKTSIKRS